MESFRPLLFEPLTQAPLLQNCLEKLGKPPICSYLCLGEMAVSLYAEMLMRRVQVDLVLPAVANLFLGSNANRKSHPHTIFQ